MTKFEGVEEISEHGLSPSYIQSPLEKYLQTFFFLIKRVFIADTRVISVSDSTVADGDVFAGHEKAETSFNVAETDVHESPTNTVSKFSESQTHEPDEQEEFFSILNDTDKHIRIEVDDAQQVVAINSVDDTAEQSKDVFGPVCRENCVISNEDMFVSMAEECGKEKDLSKTHTLTEMTDLQPRKTDWEEYAKIIKVPETPIQDSNKQPQSKTNTRLRSKETSTKKADTFPITENKTPSEQNPCEFLLTTQPHHEGRKQPKLSNYVEILESDSDDDDIQLTAVTPPRTHSFGLTRIKSEKEHDELSGHSETHAKEVTTNNAQTNSENNNMSNIINAEVFNEASDPKIVHDYDTNPQRPESKSEVPENLSKLVAPHETANHENDYSKKQTLSRIHKASESKTRESDSEKYLDLMKCTAARVEAVASSNDTFVRKQRKCPLLLCATKIQLEDHHQLRKRVKELYAHESDSRLDVKKRSNMFINKGAASGINKHAKTGEGIKMHRDKVHARQRTDEQISTKQVLNGSQLCECDSQASDTAGTCDCILYVRTKTHSKVHDQHTADGQVSIKKEPSDSEICDCEGQDCVCDCDHEEPANEVMRTTTHQKKEARNQKKSNAQDFIKKENGGCTLCECNFQEKSSRQVKSVGISPNEDVQRHLILSSKDFCKQKPQSSVIQRNSREANPNKCAVAAGDENVYNPENSHNNTQQPPEKRRLTEYDVFAGPVQSRSCNEQVGGRKRVNLMKMPLDADTSQTSLLNKANITKPNECPIFKCSHEVNYPILENGAKSFMENVLDVLLQTARSNKLPLTTCQSESEAIANDSQNQVKRVITHIIED